MDLGLPTRLKKLLFIFATLTSCAKPQGNPGAFPFQGPVEWPSSKTGRDLNLWHHSETHTTDRAGCK
jgi:hypothetical protein